MSQSQKCAQSVLSSNERSLRSWRYCVGARLGTFSTDGFQDGYGELDRAGLGIQGAVRKKARENKNSLATKTIPDYGVNEIVGETRTQT